MVQAAPDFEPRCLDCGYDLAGTPTEFSSTQPSQAIAWHCPECNKATSLAELKDPFPASVRRETQWALVVVRWLFLCFAVMSCGALLYGGYPFRVLCFGLYVGFLVLLPLLPITERPLLARRVRPQARGAVRRYIVVAMAINLGLLLAHAILLIALAVYVG